MTTTLKPGWLTTEFWAIQISAVLPLVTLIFHRDFSGYVQAVALGAHLLAQAVYAVQRTGLKKAALTLAVNVPAVSAALTAEVAAVKAAKRKQPDVIKVPDVAAGPPTA